MTGSHTRRPSSPAPTLRAERALLRCGHRLVAGVDEVGRGALAGPVSVGVVVVDETVRTVPAGTRDSKLLRPAARVALVPRIRRWAVASGVGHASPAEIDAVGILAALRLAADRALAAAGVLPSIVVLDGSHDWFTDPLTVGLLAEEDDHAEAGRRPTIPVTTLVKADLRCSSVAAASVLAKVERDALMVEAAVEHPRYGWAENKGYAAPEHVAALAEHGPCVLHRRSWNLPGTVGHDGSHPSAPDVVTSPQGER